MEIHKGYDGSALHVTTQLPEGYYDKHCQRCPNAIGPAPIFGAEAPGVDCALQHELALGKVEEADRSSKLVPPFAVDDCPSMGNYRAQEEAIRERTNAMVTAIARASIGY